MGDGGSNHRYRGIGLGLNAAMGFGAFAQFLEWLYRCKGYNDDYCDPVRGQPHV